MLRSHTAHEEHVTYVQNMVLIIAWHTITHKPIRSPGGCTIEATRRPMEAHWEAKAQGEAKRGLMGAQWEAIGEITRELTSRYEVM